MDKNDEILNNIPNIIIESNDKFTIVQKEDKVYISRLNNSKSQKIFRKIGFKVPKKSYLEFDEYSSYVYNQIDGKKNIYEIGQLLKLKYGNDAEPLYERLLVFLEHLKNDKKWIEYK